MIKSPTLSALRLSLAFALLAAAWTLFDHFGPRSLIVINKSLLLGDVPADAIFASISSISLFFVVRYYLTKQLHAQNALLRARDELEVRVLERTQDIDRERKKLHRILDAMPDGVCIISQDYDLEYTNPAMQQTWGAAAGRKCYAYFAERDLPCPHCRLATVISGQATRWEWHAELSAKTYEITGAALHKPDGNPAMLYIFHDITEQTLARREIETMGIESARQAEKLRLAHIETSARARELAALLEISRTMSSTLESQPLLEVILEQLRTMIEYHSAILYIRERDGITAVAYRGELALERVIGLHVPLCAAPECQLLLEQAQPILIDDMQSELPLAQAIRTAAGAYLPQTMTTTRAWMGVPLIANDQVVGMLRLDHVQPGFFTRHDADLALAIANQAAVAMENARLYAEAHKVAALEERQRMARDLHDSVSQALYGIALGAHAAREQLDRAPEKLNGTLDYILAMSATAVAEMRALVFELRPDSLAQEGLSAALSKQADALRARTGAVVNVEICEEPALSPDGKEMLYRIAQEAMQNIAKHARAARVDLRLHRQNGWVILEVYDDGVGFDAGGRYPGHYGLKTMHERALRLSGTLEIESTPQAGALIRARVPVVSTAA